MRWKQKKQKNSQKFSEKVKFDKDFNFNFRPEGRVDVYHIKWYPNKNVDDIRQKEISGNVPTEGIGRNIAVLVPDLHPGVEYMFEITTEAHGRRSQTTKTRVRTMPLITSEITVINQPEVTTALTLRYTPTPLTSALFDTYRYLNTGVF